MDNSPFSLVVVWLCIFILILLWVYFFAFSYHYTGELPWGFSVVIVGVFVSGRGLAYHNNSSAITVSFDLMLVVCLIGIFLNVNNIQKLFDVKDIGKAIHYIASGSVIGVLFGMLFIFGKATENLQPDARYTSTALVLISMQTSLAEETLFRGYLLSYLRRYNLHPMFSVVFQSFVFTGLHATRYSNNWAIILIIFTFGIVTGHLTLSKSNLFPAITIHVVSNLIGVIASSF